MSSKPPSAQPQREVTLAEKVAFLRQPAHYADHPATVDTRETHMSWVFLTDHHAYKLKKPMRTAFLDFSTLAARRHDAEQEIALNRRLAPNVYLGLEPLTLDAAGELCLEGTGTAVEWLVKMHRLPETRMLDYLIGHGTVADEAITSLGERLAAFYRAQATVPFTPAGYRERLAADITATRDELVQPDYGLPAGRVHEVAGQQLAFIDHHAGLFDARVHAHRLVEGHGDLRPEHVCLQEPPVVIDCLEFNRDLRLLDAADEIAFLGLECERLGASDIGDKIWTAYARASGDEASPALVHFYKAYRALVRAKVAIWHISDHEIDHHEKWIQRAKDYIALAERHMGEAGRSVSQ